MRRRLLNHIIGAREAHGEFESEHSGYCGTQGTYLLAWLVVLPRPADAPRAAASLVRRLQQSRSNALSELQRTGAGRA